MSNHRTKLKELSDLLKDQVRKYNEVKNGNIMDRFTARIIASSMKDTLKDVQREVVSLCLRCDSLESNYLANVELGMMELINGTIKK